MGGQDNVLSGWRSLERTGRGPTRPTAAAGPASRRCATRTADCPGHPENPESRAISPPEKPWTEGDIRIVGSPYERGLPGGMVRRSQGSALRRAGRVG